MLFKAFISYSHAATDRLASALQLALHRFAKPWYRLRALRVFRDETNLSANPALWPAIELALGESEFFLLLASPEATRSHWVKQEIDWWLAHRSADHLLILIADGEVRWDDTAGDFDWRVTTALSNNLRGIFTNEPLYVDLRWATAETNLSLRNSRFREAVLAIATPLHGVAKDELDGEDVRQYHKTRRITWSAGIALVALTISSVIAGVVAFKQRHIAIQQRNAAISRELAVDSAAMREGDPELSLLLAIEAMTSSRTVESEDALRRALSESHVRAVVGGLPANTRSVYYTTSRFSPDGLYVATGGLGEGQVLIWDAANGRTMARVGGHEDPIESVGFSPNGKLLVTVGAEGTAHVWRVPGGQSVAVLRSGDHLGSAIFGPDGKSILTTSKDGGAQLWDATTGRSLTAFHRAPVLSTSAAIDPSGKLVVTADSDHVARLWDAATGSVIAQLAGHTDTLHEVAFSPDGKLIATASGDGTARLWEAVTGRSVRVLSGHTSAVFRTVFSPDGKLLATPSGDGTARIWDVRTGKNVVELKALPTKGVLDIAFAPDGKYLATITEHIARVWDVQTGSVVAEFHGHADDVTHVAFSPDGASILTDSFDRSARLWRATPGAALVQLRGHEAPVTDVALSPDGTLAGTASADGTARVWRSSDGKMLSRLQGAGAINRVAFSPDGGAVLTAGDDGTARIWEAMTGKPVSQLQGHRGAVHQAQFSPDGKLALTASEDGTAKVWEWTTGRLVATLDAKAGPVRIAKLSPDGQHAITVSGDKVVRLWGTGNGSSVATLDPLFIETVTDAGLDSTGQAILLGRFGIAGAMEIFDTASGKWALPSTCCYTGLFSAVVSAGGNQVLLGGLDMVSLLARPQQRTTELRNPDVVTDAAFSPNGTCVLTMGAEGKIRLWEAKSGRLFMDFLARSTPGGRATFSDNSRLVIATGIDNTAQIFASDVCGAIDDVLRVARSCVTRSLRREERMEFLHEPTQ